MSSAEHSNGNVIQWRVDKLEDFQKEITQELRSLRSAINELHFSVRSRTDCPAPGTCITLQKEVREVWGEIKDIKEWQQKTERKFAWVMGAVAVITPIATMLIPIAWKHVFNLS